MGPHDERWAREGLGRELSHLESLDFSLAAVSSCFRSLPLIESLEQAKILYSAMYKLKIWRLEIVIRFTYIRMRYLKVVIKNLVIWYGF